MEAKKKYVKPAFRFVTDLGSILECLYEVYGTDGELLLKGGKAVRYSNLPVCPHGSKEMQCGGCGNPAFDALEDIYGKCEERSICSGC